MSSTEFNLLIEKRTAEAEAGWKTKEQVGRDVELQCKRTTVRKADLSTALEGSEVCAE